MSYTIANHQRRGMLLLMVMLMLALFMAIGAMLLTIAARARAAARANSHTVVCTDTIARDALDQALLALLRGATSGTDGSVAARVAGNPILENLLADKYGSSITGTGAVTSGTGSVITVSLQSLSGTTPSTQLNGRILTVIPRQGDVGAISSFRILGVSGTTFPAECYLSRLPSIIDRALPAQPFGLVINGREFTPVSGTSTPEPYDAPDDQNEWLAWPSVTNNEISGTFNRLSFSPTGSSAYAGGADNDNDGIPDGVWISGTVVTATNALISGTVVADQSSPDGGTLRFEVSYLVLDLDGRINLNTAGMADRDLGNYPTSPNVPLGMGYGPADIDPSLLFSGTAQRPTLPDPSGTSAFTGSGTSAPLGVWPNLLGAGTPTLPPRAPTIEQRRSPPVVGGIIGRSGSNTVPGIAGDDTQVGQTTTQSLYLTTVAGTAAFSSFADLKARAKVSITPPTSGTVTPQLTFFHPTWTGTANDWIDDPYEIRLDQEAPRFGMPRRPAPSANQNDDSPFTLAELERILRPADVDAPQLPQRLAAGLETAAQRARTMITTDSWDTPALTGAPARLIETFMTGTNVSGARFMPPLSYVGATAWLSGTTPARNVMPAEIAAGLRLNINRPVASGTTPQALSEQHEYCKDLYTLVMALSGTSGAGTTAIAAQWAANVLDFRDADSRLTGFEYDTDLRNGWNVDGSLLTTSDPDRAVVWGAERPEFVITETAACSILGTNELLVTLHRPARTATVQGISGTTPIEQPHPEIGAATISLADTAGTSRVWQLRFGPTQVVQFSAIPSATTESQVFIIGATAVTSTTATVSIAGNTTAAAPVGANGYLCVRSASTSLFNVGAGLTAHPVVSGSFVVLASGSISLERLADPARANSADNPYVPVDTAAVTLQTLPPPAPLQTNRRTQPIALSQSRHPMAGFWRQEWTLTPTVTLGTYTVGTPAAPWFHWPNRPFVSQAELAVVGSGTTAGRTSTDQLLADFNFPSPGFPVLSLATSTTAIPIPFGLTGTTTSGTMSLGNLILEATYVPTRFAGNALTVTDATIQPLGFSEPGQNTLPKWREPGRVNVNTIVMGTGSTDSIVWAALTGGTTASNPFMTLSTVSGSIPARSLSQLLALSTSGTQQMAMPPVPASDPRGLNPFLAASLPIRLANTATVRSNVFAVWITVRITDDSPNAPSPVTKRLFAIVDRSIPVGYLPNQDLNVRDTIRLKRYID